MKQLVSIEYSKLRKLNSLRVILLIYMVMIPLWMFMTILGIESNQLMKVLLPKAEVFCSFPHVWSFTTYCASFFNVLMGVTIVIITCNEIQFKTMRQNVIDGLTKREVILSKFMAILMISTIITVYTSLVAMILGLIYSGPENIYQNVHYIFVYFLQTLGYFSFAFLLASLILRPAVSIITFVLLFPIETVVGVFLPRNVYAFFPLNVFSKLTPFPFSNILVQMEENKRNVSIWVMPEWMNSCIALGYIILFFVIAYYVLKRRDL